MARETSNRKNGGKQAGQKQQKDIAQIITNSLNKHGEIKGKNKKETKNLRAMCTHHKYTKKGKKKADIINEGNGNITCLMCSSKFNTHLADKNEIHKIVNKLLQYLNQCKFMAEAAGLGKGTINYLAELCVQVSHFEKVYCKTKHVVERAEHVKNKKKKNKNYGTGSEDLGSWR